MYSPRYRFSNPLFGFSLVELLVVVAVIGLLTALTFAGMGSFKSSNLRRAAAMAGDLADEALDSAVRNRRETALAIVTAGPDAYRAMAVLERRDGGTWAVRSRWQVLPESVIFDPADAQAKYFSEAKNQISNSLWRGGAELRPSDFKAQEFRRDGALYAQTDPLVLRLREGYLENGSSAPVYTAGTMDRYFDLVLIPTGGRVKRMQP